jgi:hypothetical protein
VVLVVGEWITDTKFEAGGIVMGDVIAQVYVRGPQTQLDGSEVPVLTGRSLLIESSWKLKVYFAGSPRGVAA